jgi:4-hydroxy-3-methylbut-2-enyl diphosphate reductase
MKTFNIPSFYRSPLIGKIKELRKASDPRKKDFSPTVINFGAVQFIIPRHFGFCYGVENAIELSYKALAENPGKRIFLLSQMIHNPEVNDDLQANGINFIMDTQGNYFIDWDEINENDIVIIPAFGTTLEIEKILQQKNIETARYNTTCPFVERVWNKAEKLGKENYSIIIHGKHLHEETRATFSHSKHNAPSLVIKDMNEAILLGEIILGIKPTNYFYEFFKNKYSDGFDAEKDLLRIGVINQTTMLATETQAIADYLKKVMIQKYGETNIKNHFADTRDTLCYATNDNQSSTLALLDTEADIAIVIGGYNSSNTTHLVELLEEKFPVYFINNEKNIWDDGTIEFYNIHILQCVQQYVFNTGKPSRIIITSGASCPDSVLERVIHKIIGFYPGAYSVENVLETFKL